MSADGSSSGSSADQSLAAQSVEDSDFGGYGLLPLPRHVAIIMDGNGRWATGRGKPRAVGHKKGSEAVGEAIEGAIRCGVEYLTLYAFSSENWARPAVEVRDLMGLLRLYLRNEIARLHREGIRLRVIGHRADLARDINVLIDEAEAKTANNTRLTLVIALSYGARAEITDAARALATAVVEGRESLENITETRLAKELSTADMPDPDLIIRTSGEERLSNFLMWQAAYSELMFIDTLWPDFTKALFEEAIAAYRGRDRRFGKR